jgi:hypothetical protein
VYAQGSLRWLGVLWARAASFSSVVFMSSSSSSSASTTRVGSGRHGLEGPDAEVGCGDVRLGIMTSGQLSLLVAGEGKRKSGRRNEEDDKWIEMISPL